MDIDISGCQHTFGRSYPYLYTVWSLFRNKKVSFVYQTKETFLSDAFLAEREAHCVRDADFVCDARLRRVLERIASPITAQRHHLSLICKEAYFAI